MNGLFLMKQAQIHLLCISQLVLAETDTKTVLTAAMMKLLLCDCLDGLACAEFKEFDEHKVELNLTWPMVKSTADSALAISPLSS